MAMNRREFMGSVAGGVAAAALGGRTARAARRPNILVILADDMGFSDVGCYGSEIQTPNIDRLAGEGIRFTQAYNAARCCPSRAALLTGLYPHQAGMGAMVSTAEKPAEPGAYQGYLNGDCVTIAEALKPAGYRTYMSGKWHVGEAPEHWPCRRGFDRYFGLISGASSYFELLEEDANRQMALDSERYFPPAEGFYMTDAFADHAVKCLEEHDASQPFFHYLAFTAPHWPLHALPQDIAKYRGKYRIGWDELRKRRYRKQLELGIIDPKWALSPRDPDVPAWEDAATYRNVGDHDEWDLRMAVYAAMIDRMDQGIGRVLDTLRKKGLDEDTLILFMSDNGGCHENADGRKLHKEGARAGGRGSFRAYERPWANASNTPFRLFKHWIHEGGIATPLIARWPSAIRQGGALTHQVAHITDVMATCLDVAGAEYPREHAGRAITPLVGKSLVPVLEGKTREPHQRLYWEHFANRGVREGNWKLVATKDGQWELYDLEADRTELNNLVDANRAKAAELYEAWEQWAKDCGAKIPPGQALGDKPDA